MIAFWRCQRPEKKGFLETQSVQSLLTKEAEDDKRQNYGLGLLVDRYLVAIYLMK